MSYDPESLADLKRRHQMAWAMTRIALIRAIPYVVLIGIIGYLWL